MAISVPAKRRSWGRSEAPAETPPAATLDATVAVRAVVAAALFGAAAVHFAFAPDHFDESRVHGSFFFLAGWIQLGLGLAVLLRPSRALLRVVVLVNVAMVLVWGMSRLTGMPVGDDAWVAEAVGVPDVVATALEVVAVVGGYLLLTGRLAALRMSRSGAVAGGALLALALVGLTTASVAPALAGSHSHGATGHAAGGDAHSHAATGPAAGTGNGGAGQGDGTAAPAAGIETASGTSPCEQSGAPFEKKGAGAGGHGHHGPSAQVAITDAATRQVLAEQLSTARSAALRYPAAADATAAGYRKITNYLPCIAAHYMRFPNVDRTFDPSAPEMLLYDGNGPDARIVGLSYFVTGTQVAPDGFAGPNDPWHQHVGLCISGALVVGSSDLTEAECAARGGIKADGTTSWMVHAWVVPGWESAWGTFSAEHPELGVSVPR